MDKKILLPESLTAENGAKYLLNGEFYEEVEQYDEEGYQVEDMKVYVSWTTIKEIYRKIVEHYGEKELESKKETSFVCKECKKRKPTSKRSWEMSHICEDCF